MAATPQQQEPQQHHLEPEGREMEMVSSMASAMLKEIKSGAAETKTKSAEPL